MSRFAFASVVIMGALAATLPATSAQDQAAIEASLAKAAAEAGRQASEGKYIEALDTLRSASDVIWDASPLGFRRAVLVAGPPSGFGVYDVREGSAYKAGEQMLVYLEPVGYGYRAEGDIQVLELVADVELKTAAGEAVGGQKNFAKFGFRSRVKNREFYAFVTYNFTGLQPGDYIATTILTDSVTGKTGSVDVTFSVAP